MRCEKLELGGGAVAIVCSRGRRLGRCVVCRRAQAVRLCDYELRQRTRGKTCDAKLCEQCAERVGPDRDLCPAHARLVRAAGVQPELLASPYANAMHVVADQVEQNTKIAPPATSDEVRSELASLALQLSPAKAQIPATMRRVTEEWEERAAIRRYLGGMTLADAEREALRDAAEVLSTQRSLF